MSISSKVKNFFESMMKPSPAAVFQAAKALKPHSPMIKFRYGAGAGSGGAAGHSSASTPSSAGATAGASAGQVTVANAGKPNATTQLPTIEDWQLPQRYRRRPIEQEEIDYINNGGPV